MIRTMFELLVNIIENFIIVDFMVRFLGSKFEGKKKHVGFLAIWILLIAEISFFNYVTPFEGIAILISILTLFVYARLFLKGNFFMCIFSCVFIFSILLITSHLLTLSFVYITNKNLTELYTEFIPPRIILVIISKILFFYVTRIILKFKKSPNMQFKDWIPLVVIPFISIISITFLMLAIIDSTNLQGKVLISAVGMLVINILTYYFFIRIGKESQLALDLALLQQQYNYRNESTKEMRFLYQNIQSVRHDMKNHLTSVAALIAENKCEEAQNYISSIVADRIDIKQGYTFTDNEVFNAIIGTKLTVCEKQGIYVDVGIHHSLHNVSNEDLTVLIGNLFDNAIEACKNSENKKIQFKVQPQGYYTSIFMSNSIDVSVLNNNPELKTTKSEKIYHGIGLKNIQNIVEKYNGMIDFFEEDGEFCCDILIEGNNCSATDT